ncbi:MAG: helicase C-terminal domain-containing protein [Candidatus Aenigmatarchaeota archaeon]
MAISRKLSEIMSVEKDLFPLIFEVFSRQPPSDAEIYEEKKYDCYLFEKARKGHNEAIEAILNAKDIVYLTAPTGTGKTAVYLTALIESGATGLILVPRNGLQLQIAEYPVKDRELLYLFAKEKHCKNKVIVKNEEVPLCELKVKRNGQYYVQYNGDLLPYPPCAECPYFKLLGSIREKLTKNECIPILNTGNFWPFRGLVDFVVIDEADEALRMIKDAVSEKGVYIAEPLEVLEWMKKKKLEEIEKLEKMLERDLSDVEVARINRRINKLKRALDKIQLFENEFINKLITYMNKSRNRTYVEVFDQDLSAIAKRLFEDAKILLVTATPPLNSQAQHVSFSLPFPRTAIFYYPIANLSVRNLKREGSELLEDVVLNVIIPTYEFITKLTGVGKVPIHAGNLSKHGATVAQILNENGFKAILMEEGKQKEAVEEFRKGDYEFLCIVSAEYGYDWVDYPLQIVLKVPYTDLYDPRTQAIKCFLREKFDEWYAWDALSRVIQACGRNVRDPRKFAISLILDSRFGVEYSRFENLIPQWFKERLIWVKPSSSLEKKSQV